MYKPYLEHLYVFKTPVLKLEGGGGGLRPHQTRSTTSFLKIGRLPQLFKDGRQPKFFENGRQPKASPLNGRQP